MSHRKPSLMIESMVSLIVDNLSYKTTLMELKKLFERCGKVGDIYIPRDPISNTSRGFAFVRFYDKQNAKDAMYILNGCLINGRKLRIQMARSNRKRSRSPRSRSRDDRSHTRSHRRTHSESSRKNS